MRRRGEPFIETNGVEIDARDVEALRTVAASGSMNRAASELGRSYARIQQRIVELEEAVGPLVTRQRGGEGGGGSTLTPRARRLVDRFDRLRAEFAGLARAEESVFAGRVVDRSGALATVETAAGTVTALVPVDADAVQVSVRSDVVVLTAPDETPEPGGTSVRNQFHGRVSDVRTEEGIGRVTVDVGAETPLRALVTQTSLDRLELAAGEPVDASFKATATRAIPHEGDGVGGAEGESAEVEDAEVGTDEADDDGE